METCKSWSYFLRLLFIAGLFTVFVCRFAWPSFNKYLHSGVFVDQSTKRRENKDSPTITFCALNNETEKGWKKKIDEIADFYKTWPDKYCDNPEKIDDAVTCLNNGTFNLTETIRVGPNKNLNFIGPDHELWIEDVSEPYKRGVFKEISSFFATHRLIIFLMFLGVYKE